MTSAAQSRVAREEELAPVTIWKWEPLARWNWMLPPLIIAFGIRLAVFLMGDIGAKLILGNAFAGNFATWHRFDAGFYIKIAAYGYVTPDPVHREANFFPLFPMAMSFVGHLVALVYPHDPFNIGGIIVSWLSFAAACVVLYRLVRDRFDEATALGSVLLLATFPFGFYFGIAYSEALYVLVTLLAFLGIERRNWALAAIGAMLAGACRPPGLIVGGCVVVAYGLDWWQSRHGWRRDVFWLLLTPAGTLAYLLFCWVALGNPLAYKVASQQGWHASKLNAGNIQAAWHLFVGFSGPADYNVRLYRIYFLLVMLFLLAMVLVWRWLGPVYVLYSVPSIIAPVITLPHPTSLGRYLSVVFPVFIVAAMLVSKHPPLRYALVLGCAVFLSLFALMFAMHYPVY